MKTYDAAKMILINILSTFKKEKI